MTTPVTVTVPVAVDFDKITNAIVGAIEGGYSPWFNQFHVTDDCHMIRHRFIASDLTWYAEPAYWTTSEGKAEIGYDLPDGEEGEFAGKMVIDRAKLEAGLAAMATKAPRHFADLINENDDAITHDVFMQMVVLGDIIYG